MSSRFAAPLTLAALTLLFFADLLFHPGRVLYSDTSDLLAEHVPAKRFLVRSWRETGELPLWCPYSYSGSPFLHDPQVGLFYPPYALFLVIPEGLVGPALSWLVVGHLFLGGWGMYVYGRSRDLAPLAALVAAVGFLFAGKWLLHLLAAGHTITVGLAWLPWFLVVLEGTLKTPSRRRVALASGLFALIVLGTQPQWTFYAGLFSALWTVGLVREQPDRRRAWGRWLGVGGSATALAVALAAVQLLPTLEAAGQSTRGGGVPTDDVLPGGLRSLLFFFGPALTAAPPVLGWEDRGGFGVLWVAAAALAPFLLRGRVRWEAGVVVGLLIFSFGGAILVQRLPGFNLFRQPARMLLIATFPVAYLAGVTTQALFAGPTPTAETWALARRVLVRVGVAATLLCSGFALRLTLMGETPRPHVYWVSLLVTLPAAYALLASPTRFGEPGRVSAGSSPGANATGLAWGVVLLIDLWVLAWPLVQTRSEDDIYPQSAIVASLGSPAPGSFRILDRDADGGGSPLGVGAPLAPLLGLETLRGYNPLDVRHTKEFYLLLGGEERPLVPFQEVLAFPVVDNFPIVHKPLLDLLGVRYVVQPRDLDASWQLPGSGWRRVADDPQPRGYDFTGGGVRTLPPYTLWENADALPRAFVVPEATPLPSPALEALTTTDFRRRVLLEGWDGSGPRGDEPSAARVVSHLPNRVVVEADGPGWLVLTDVWYPGWRCDVDGEAAPLYRANALFRATPLAAGTHRLTFAFEPSSYRLGRWVSGAALVALVLGMAWPLGKRPPVTR